MGEMFGFGGLHIVESRHMVDRVEDWSEVRSPSRAERRRERGFPQRIKTREVPKPDLYQMGDKLVGHHETILAMREALKARAKEPSNG